VTAMQTFWSQVPDRVFNHCLRLWLASLLATSSVWANTGLKLIDLRKGEDVAITFDGKVDSNRISVEYFNDVIQFSLSGVSVYPAKVKSSTEGPISKVFVYQYSPKIVRCRISVRGSSDSFKKQLTMSSQGRILRIRLSGSISSVAAQTDSAQPANSTKDISNLESKSPQLESKRTQDKVERGSLYSDTRYEKAEGKRPVLGGAKPMPSMGMVFLKLAMVISLFSALAFGVNRFGVSKKGKSNGILNAIQKVSGIQLGSKQNLIEVLSTQNLGPKKSISVVRVGGRTLVLGLSQDSIQLITQLSGVPESGGDLSEDAEFLGEATSSEPPSVSFADLLGDQKEPPTRMASQGVRSRIRSRLEGLKPL